MEGEEGEEGEGGGTGAAEEERHGGEVYGGASDGLPDEEP